ncbi:MAG TPA: hypothetical protein PKD09_09430 [Aggregatilinea sp.]|uniref:hypothetical protein n=1 Tax=Aggregatilinea sp. TaxID=2806333 RepID=UPI002C899165|nr:hypothetical protein [Aggregatilinea sp.]HML21858.1 hypothetical protein [Aggregatilinea sp.]
MSKSKRCFRWALLIWISVLLVADISDGLAALLSNDVDLFGYLLFTVSVLMICAAYIGHRLGLWS